jgi:hypothetical protein
MKLMSLFFIATCSFVTGCAGSTSFQSCEPKVCGVDCEIAPGVSCSDNELTLSPGGSATVKAKLNVEGSHEGNFRFTVSAGPPLTATVSPASADMVDGTPLDVVVTLNLDASAMPGGRFIAQLEATNADAEVGAGTSIVVKAPMP